MASSLRSLLPPISVKTTVTCLAWYSVSSITSQLTKLILVKFSYPLFLGSFQFFIGAVLALCMITIVKAFPEMVSQFPPGSVPNDVSLPTFRKAVLFKILPLGLFQFAGKFFSLSATSLIPLATVSSVKALSPLLIVLGYRFVYKVKFPLITYLSLTPLVGGVIFIIFSDSLHVKPSSKANLIANENNRFNYSQMKGLAFCIVSTLIFAAQNIYGKQLITWDSSTTASPASLALNTELSRPGTPSLNSSSEKINEYPRLAPSVSKPKHYIRQRTNSIKLPFSTHDIKYEDRYHSNNNSNEYLPYDESVNQANQNINNPLSNFMGYEPIAKPDKMTIILYCSMIGFTFSIGGFIMKELPSILMEPIKGSVDSISEVFVIIVLIILDSLSHFLQTLLAFHLLGSIPTLSYSIASMMKRIVLITVSLLIVMDSSNIPDPESKWFGRITSEQFYGLILIAIGLYSYDRWGSRSLKGHI